MRGRITITKSLGFLKGKVVSATKDAVMKIYEAPLSELHENLTTSLK